MFSLNSSLSVGLKKFMVQNYIFKYVSTNTIFRPTTDIAFVDRTQYLLWVQVSKNEDRRRWLLSIFYCYSFLEHAKHATFMDILEKIFFYLDYSIALGCFLYRWLCCTISSRYQNESMSTCIHSWRWRVL